MSFASQVRPSILTPHRLLIYAGSRALDRSLPSIARRTPSSYRPSMLAPCFATTLGFGTPFRVPLQSGSSGSNSSATAWRSFAGARTRARVVR
eukprot:851509-Heterocapsa_arctica.AAC.1